MLKEKYHDLKSNYDYMSKSQFSDFMECEAMAMAIIKGDWIREKTESMLEGLYLHAWNEGKLDEFKKKHPEMFMSLSIKDILVQLKEEHIVCLLQKYPILFNKNGEFKSNIKKDILLDCIKRENIDILTTKLKECFKRCDQAIDIIKKDNLLTEALKGEKEKIFISELYGCNWKIMIDNYFPEKNRFSDLKYLKDLNSKYWDPERNIYLNVLEKRGYLIQMSLYAKIESIANNRSKLLEPYLVIITKEKYPDKDIIGFAGDMTTHEEEINRILREDVEPYIERILSVKSEKVSPIRCEKCDYCKSTKVLKNVSHFTKYNLY